MIRAEVPSWIRTSVRRESFMPSGLSCRATWQAELITLRPPRSTRHLAGTLQTELRFVTCNSRSDSGTTAETFVFLGEPTALQPGGEGQWGTEVTLTSATPIDTVSLVNTGDDGWCSAAANYEVLITNHSSTSPVLMLVFAH